MFMLLIGSSKYTITPDPSNGNKPSNPADAASRGLTAQRLMDDDSLWLRGPEFLWQPRPYQAQIELKPQPLDPDDPEVNKQTTLVTETTNEDPYHFEIVRLNRFSDWFQAKQTVARYLKERKKTRKVTPARYQPVNVEEVNQAGMQIICCLRYEHFKDEIQATSLLLTIGEFCDRTKAKQRNVNVKKHSSFYRRDPYLDVNVSCSLVLVGGKLAYQKKRNIQLSYQDGLTLLTSFYSITISSCQTSRQ